ncbi:MAG TPA: C25 family cysteine peptidase [Bdellovibrionales bacterium]|nr:C25 family cysteine peptidase [Bdellovibrionales bacterium]
MIARGVGLLTVLWLVAAGTNAWAAWHDLGTTRGKTEPVWEVVSSDAQLTLVKVTLAGFESKTIKINGQDFVQLQVPGFSLTDDKGLPELPRANRNFVVPATATDVRLEVDRVVTQEFDLGAVAPSKGAIERSQNPETVPYTFASFYRASGLYPSENVSAGNLFIFRDTKGVNVAVRPFQYDAASKRLIVAKEITFALRTFGARNAQLFRHVSRDGTVELDAGFESMYRKFYLNAGHLEADFKPVKNRMTDTGKLLVIYKDELFCGLQQFINWKIQKGMDVVAMPMSKVGTGYTAVKNAIIADYKARRTSYVHFIGDAEHVPFHPGKSGNANRAEADPLYGVIEGNDAYPELIVSRFSAKNCDGVNTQIAKSLNYEMSPEVNGAWYSKGVNIASNEGSPTDKERAEWLKRMMRDSYYQVVDSFYDPSASKANLIKSLNEGRGFINYIGHGSETMWVTTGFSNNDITALNNSMRLPFIVSVACVNGAFAGGVESFGERWLLAGTPAAPKGAVAVFASSTNQSWVPPTVGQYEITRLLAKNEMTTVGMLFAHGAVAVLEDASSTANQTFETWHIFGDATVQVRTLAPAQINAELPGQLIGERANNAYMVKVKEPGITVALSFNGQLLGSAISDKTGMAKVGLQNLPQTGTKAMLTMTGFNKMPKMVEVVLK